MTQLTDLDKPAAPPIPATDPPEPLTTDGTPIFRLVRFNPRRAARGAEAAEVEITDEDNQVRLWMSRKNIEDNIKAFGAHPGLIAAREAYRNGVEIG